MFLQNEGWNGVNSQEFRAALQSLQRELESRGRASMGRERRVWCELTFVDSLASRRVRWVLCSVLGGNGTQHCLLPCAPAKILTGYDCSWLDAAGMAQHCPTPPCPPVCPGQGCAPALGLSSWLGTEEPSGSWEQSISTGTSTVIVSRGYGSERITQRNRPRFPHAEGVLPPQRFSPPSYPFTAGLLPFLCQKIVLVIEKSRVCL